MHTLRKLICLILLTLMLIAFSERGHALQLRVNNVNANPGDTITVDITVEDYSLEQIAAAALTLSYSTEYLTLTQVESDFFDTFANQWNLLNPVPNPLPPSSIVIDGQAYTQPLLFNIVENALSGRTLLVGARVKSGTPTILYTLHFTVNEQTAPGIYPVSISPIIIKDVHAGYADTGEAIPLLVDAIEGQNDPTLAYPFYSPDIVNGAVYVQSIFVDSDNDNIDDNWEMAHFGDLTTANQTSDFDKDGYSDLQEYLNGAAGELDPLGNIYDPKIKNAPGGTGYIPISNNSSFWLLMNSVLQLSINHQQGS